MVNPANISFLTRQEIINYGTAQLRSATAAPRREAELLLAHLLHCQRLSLLTYPEHALTSAEAQNYNELLRRRVAGEPLPYITGKMEFYGLDFAVTPAVLIPRPETELLVDEALAWLDIHPCQRAVEVGTGSGCIATTLAVRAPALRLTATDISPSALQVARANAARHGVTGRLSFVQGDLLAPLAGPLELLLSNPPYVATYEWDLLPVSVREEPHIALLAGPQGLDTIHRLLAQASTRLRPGGLLLVEFGERQGNAVRTLARETFPAAQVEIKRDLAGRERLLRVERVSEKARRRVSEKRVRR
ncbi:MAG TPA: peptide chain release factor N(5)-glutamine methyltransferase [Thermoflexia bacterium]|nr:peptide chain release factor N(5)-glutamine methyltransferase [Thermoflexia bacterium]